MNKYRVRVLFILTFTVGATAACANTPTDFDAFAEPAPPPPVSYSEDIHANAMAVAANATAQTAYASALSAREKARSAALQGTTMARATDRALETRGTEVALMAAATAVQLQAQQQAAAAQSTGEAQTRIAEATRLAIAATSTAVAIQASQERTAADWERSVVLPIRKGGIAVVIVLLLVALAFFGVRLFDALILRVRIIRDPSGHAIVFGERDRRGRQTVVLPNRAPGPVLQLTPPQVEPHQVSVDGADADVTQRAQLIEALGLVQRTVPRIASPRILGEMLPGQGLGSLTQLPVVRLIPTDQLPPGQIADGLAIEAIEADWRRQDE